MQKLTFTYHCITEQGRDFIVFETKYSKETIKIMIAPFCDMCVVYANKVVLFEDDFFSVYGTEDWLVLICKILRYMKIHLLDGKAEDIR